MGGRRENISYLKNFLEGSKWGKRQSKNIAQKYLIFFHKIKYDFFLIKNKKMFLYKGMNEFIEIQ